MEKFYNSTKDVSFYNGPNWESLRRDAEKVEEATRRLGRALTVVGRTCLALAQEVDGRVKHLMLYGRKERTKKKNRNRLKREVRLYLKRKYKRQG